jgi:sortase A
VAGRTVDDLSIEELERLILVRRRQARLAARQGKSFKPKVRRPLTGWEKLLRLTELAVILALLATFFISGRGWIAIRQRLPLPTDGVTFVQPPEAPPAALVLPPIGATTGDVPSAEPVSAQASQVPDHLQGWIDPAPAQPVPAPVPVPASRIVIPSIEVDAPVTEGTDWESLKYRVGHHPGTTNPGQRGNMVLAAHNDVYGEIFRYLPDVPLGEIVTVYAEEQVYRYRITGRRIILPNQVEVMAPTTGPTLTLISCYPYLIDTHRIVLFAELIG